MLKIIKMLVLFIGLTIIVTGCSQALSLIGGGSGYGPYYPNFRDAAYGNATFISVEDMLGRAVSISPDSGDAVVAGEIGCSAEHIEYLNGNFVASYAGCEGNLYKSTDGRNWGKVSISMDPPPEFPDVSITPVAYWAGYYFGWAAGRWPAEPAVSADLENWQEPEGLPDALNFCGATTTEDELLVNGFNRVAVNTDPVDPEDWEFKTVSYIFSSSDGKSFTSSQLPDGIIICGDMAYGDGVLVASNGLIDDSDYEEYSIDTDRGLFSLSDGGDWKQTYANNEEKILDVAYGNGTFVAVGEKGLVVTSPNGLTWSEEHLGSGYDFNAVVYGDGSFVAVGDHGLVAVSTDGSNWLVREVTLPW